MEGCFKGLLSLTDKCYWLWHVKFYQSSVFSQSCFDKILRFLYFRFLLSIKCFTFGNLFGFNNQKKIFNLKKNYVHIYL